MYFCILSEWLSWLRKQSQRNMLKAISATFNFIQKKTKCGLVSRTIVSCMSLACDSCTFVGMCITHWIKHCNKAFYYQMTFLNCTVTASLFGENSYKTKFLLFWKKKTPAISSRNSIPFALCKANFVNHKFLDELEDLSFPWYAPLLAAFPLWVVSSELWILWWQDLNLKLQVIFYALDLSWKHPVIFVFCNYKAKCNKRGQSWNEAENQQI